MERRTLKLFTSYSHQDERHFKNFKKHLITLKRNKIIDDFDDYKLTAGDLVDNELYDMIEKSDLIVFLISIDFINSEYCFNQELKQALDRLDNDEIRIIPIVVEKCKWQNTILGKYLSATKNGEPVSKYDDENDAWCEVIESIEKSFQKYHETIEKKEQKNIEKNLILTSTMSKFLNDTEVVFNHRFKERLLLDDIYVYPELKVISQEIDELGSVIDSSELIKKKKNDNKILIIGGDQSGKTTLAKRLYKDYLALNNLPILIDANTITKTDIEKILKKTIPAQYEEINYSNFSQLNLNKILIIDDFQNIGINTKYQNIFVKNCENLFNQIVILSDASIRYDDSKYVELTSYDQFEILTFNNYKRGELVEKWNTIGQEETIDLRALHNINDATIYNIDGIIRKNVLPPKPIYLLSIIQTLDTSKGSDHSLTSYGHCYQSIIQKNLDCANIRPDEFDLFTNYLSEIAYHIFKTGRTSIDSHELDKFKSQYSENYVIHSHKHVIDSLIKAGVLKIHNEKYMYSYRYIFYFYVAKYISDHIEKEHCKKDISYLCDNLHTEKNSNILIFLVHHSKDQYIVDEILLNTWSLFEEFLPAKLNIDETTYLANYVNSLPELVIEQQRIERENISKARTNRLKQKDKLDKLEDETESDDIQADDEFSENGLKTLNNKDNVLSQINSSVRSVEIIGQILRNRHGSLTKKQLKDLTLTSFNAGLKFLTFFIQQTDDHQDQIIDLIDKIIRQNSDLPNEKITKHARNIFLFMCYSTLFSVISKLTQSVGTSKLISIFQEISEENDDSLAIKLILISIHLEFNKNIPKNEIESFINQNNKNDISIRLLQEIVIQHMYFNHVEYKDRQWISSKLKLPIKTQRRIQENIQQTKLLTHA